MRALIWALLVVLLVLAVVGLLIDGLWQLVVIAAVMFMITAAAGLHDRHVHHQP